MLHCSCVCGAWVQGCLAPEDVPRCSCGAARSFEFQVTPSVFQPSIHVSAVASFNVLLRGQVLPQMLFYLLEDEEVGDGHVDWGTLVVFTCEARCGGGGGGYAEEVVWRQMISEEGDLLAKYTQPEAPGKDDLD